MEEEEILTPILYPAYIEKQYRERTLCYFFDYQLVTERGDIHTITEFSTFLWIIFELNLLVFMLHLASFPWIDEVIRLGDKINTSKNGKFLSIRIRGARNTTRMIVNGAGWGAEELSVEWLQKLRSVYERAGVGTPGSPGSVGQALFRKCFKEQYGEETWIDHRHRRPPDPYCEVMREQASGARSEVFQLNVAFTRAYENDQHNGYGFALSQSQPTGKCYRVSGKGVLYCKIYFVECIVTIHEQLELGCFPVRVGEGDNRRPIFPTHPGTYETWLWNLEIEDCRKIGITVVLKWGFGWKETTQDFRPFVETVARLRNEAPEEIKGYFKLILVSAIGQLGMPSERHFLVSGDDRQDGDRCLADAGIAYDWWIHTEPDVYPQSMPHIFYHTLMLCRRELYEMALRCIHEELNVIALNTDAVFTEIKPDIPEKGTPVHTGDWTALALHNMRIPANRQLISDEKIRGVPKKEKAKSPSNRCH